MNSQPLLPPLLDALAEADSDEQRKELLNTNPSLSAPRAVKALYDRVAHDLRKDLSKAAVAAQSALYLARTLNHTESVALSLRALGNVQLLEGKPENALDKFHDALSLFLEDDCRAQAAQTQLNIFAALLSLARYKEANDIAITARKQLGHLGDSLGLARLDNNLGSLLFRQEDFKSARKHWQSALVAFKELGQSHDAAIALRNLAVCEISLNHFREALTIYAEVSQYCKKHNLTLLLHEIDYNIAYLYFLQGDHDRALDGYRLARERSLRLGDSYHAALCDLDEAELYLELNLLPDGIGLARRAASAFRELGKTYEAAKALAFEAIAAARLLDDHQALTLLHAAHSDFSSQGHVAWASLTSLYEALVLLQEGRRFEATRSAGEALRGFQHLDTPGKAALCHLLLARLHLESADTVSARAAVGTAIDLVSHLAVPHILYQAHFIFGDIAEQENRHEDARTAYYEALHLLQSLRTQLSAADLHIPFPQSSSALYERLLHLESVLSTPKAFPQTAFALVEQEKARTISDLLGPRAYSIEPSRPTRSGLVEQVRGLREELRWHYKKLASQEMAATPREDSDSQPSFDRLESSLLSSLTEISRDDREFGDLHQLSTVSLQQAQDFLNPDEVVLEYFVGEDIISVLVVSRSHCACLPVAISSEVSELRRLLDFHASRMRPSSVTSPRDGGRVELERRCLGRLYQELVAPVASEIAAFSHLKIIPHGFLTYLPFHAFVVTDGSEAELGDRFLLSYASSVASLQFGRERTLDSRDKSALVFIDEDERSEPDNPLLRTPWRGEMIPYMTQRRKWQKRLAESWKVVEIPIRAAYRLDNPALSGISVSGAQMTFLELFQIQIAANVVVIPNNGPRSTGTGNGDELVCLSRALLYSGPRAIVIPLRRCRPRPMSHVLEQFYNRLAGGSPSDEALQAAQRAAKAEFPHMADWAPLALYGF